MVGKHKLCEKRHEMNADGTRRKVRMNISLKRCSSNQNVLRASCSLCHEFLEVKTVVDG